MGSNHSSRMKCNIRLKCDAKTTLYFKLTNLTGKRVDDSGTVEGAAEVYMAVKLQITKQFQTYTIELFRLTNDC